MIQLMDHELFLQTQDRFDIYLAVIAHENAISLKFSQKRGYGAMARDDTKQYWIRRLKGSVAGNFEAGSFGDASSFRTALATILTLRTDVSESAAICSKPFVRVCRKVHSENSEAMYTMTNQSTIVDLMTESLKLLVEHPDQLTVQVVPGAGQTLVLCVKCAKTDPGRLIGKQGRTSRSLRVILNGISIEQEQRFTLDIASNHEHRNSPQTTDER